VRIKTTIGLRVNVPDDAKSTPWLSGTAYVWPRADYYHATIVSAEGDMVMHCDNSNAGQWVCTALWSGSPMPIWSCGEGSGELLNPSCQETLNSLLNNS